MSAYTPVVPPRGGKVHAVLMSGDQVGRTLCRRRFEGWPIGVTDVVTCRACLARMA